MGDGEGAPGRGLEEPTGAPGAEEGQFRRTLQAKLQLHNYQSFMWLNKHQVDHIQN